jgi:hypothetical protein
MTGKLRRRRHTSSGPPPKPAEALAGHQGMTVARSGAVRSMAVIEASVPRWHSDPGSPAVDVA